MVFAAVLIGVLVWTALAATALALCRAAGRADHSETTEAELAGISPADMLQAADGLSAPAVERREVSVSPMTAEVSAPSVIDR